MFMFRRSPLRNTLRAQHGNARLVHVSVVFLTNCTVRILFYMMVVVVMMVRVGLLPGREEWSQRQAIGNSFQRECILTRRRQRRRRAQGCSYLPKVASWPHKQPIQPAFHTLILCRRCFLLINESLWLAAPLAICDRNVDYHPFYKSCVYVRVRVCCLL